MYNLTHSRAKKKEWEGGEMAEEIRRIAGGGGGVRGSADERKPSANSTAPDPSAGVGISQKKVTLKSADMKEDMQQEAIDCALAAFEKHGVEKEVAEYIKKEFDRNHGPTWHCIVGRNFGSYVTHETNHFIYFYLDSKAILLFKSG